jgi:hypothetical protein
MNLMIGAFAVLCFLRGNPPKQNFPRSRRRRIQGFPGPAFSRSASDCRDMVVRQEFRSLAPRKDRRFSFSAARSA